MSSEKPIKTICYRLTLLILDTCIYIHRPDISYVILCRNENMTVTYLMNRCDEMTLLAGVRIGDKLRGGKVSSRTAAAPSVDSQWLVCVRSCIFSRSVTSNMRVLRI